MYKRILVPIDGSETSQKALTAALSLAQEAGARLRVLHVVEDLIYLASYGDFAGYSYQIKATLDEAGSKILQDALTTATAAGVVADSTRINRPGARLGESVAEEAKNWGADLIVVGTHGRRGVDRFLMGSGAEQVIRLAPAHTLIVRGA